MALEHTQVAQLYGEFIDLFKRNWSWGQNDKYVTLWHSGNPQTLLVRLIPCPHLWRKLDTLVLASNFMTIFRQIYFNFWIFGPRGLFQGFFHVLHRVKLIQIFEFFCMLCTFAEHTKEFCTALNLSSNWISIFCLLQKIALPINITVIL